jgi:hypothetical protein
MILLYSFSVKSVASIKMIIKLLSAMPATKASILIV